MAEGDLQLEHALPNSPVSAQDLRQDDMGSPDRWAPLEGALEPGNRWVVSELRRSDCPEEGKVIISRVPEHGFRELRLETQAIVGGFYASKRACQSLPLGLQGRVSADGVECQANQDEGSAKPAMAGTDDGPLLARRPAAPYITPKGACQDGQGNRRAG